MSNEKKAWEKKFAEESYSGRVINIGQVRWATKDAVSQCVQAELQALRDEAQADYDKTEIEELRKTDPQKRKHDEWEMGWRTGMHDAIKLIDKRLGGE